MDKHSNLMNYDYLLETADKAAALSDQKLNGFATRFSKAINCLLKVPYWAGVDPSKPASLYESWARELYVSAGYTFAALHQLFRCGFYLEGHVLLRHLNEVLVQIAYFAQRRDRAVDHFIPEQVPRAAGSADNSPGSFKRKKKVQFRQMFDSMAPGYYDEHYSIASEFSHGGVGAIAVARGGNLVGPARTGCHYDEKRAGLLCMLASASIYGFLRRFPDAFPGWQAAEAEPTYSEAVNALEEILTAQWVESPASRPSLQVIAGLIDWQPPSEHAVAAG